NDPLVNSLTVTNHPILEFLHVHFGYHVEHHLFPTVSGVHLKAIHKELKERYPEKYLYMPKWKAMVALYKTARIYKNPTTLFNPLTGATYPTLGKVVKEKPVQAVISDEKKSSEVAETQPPSVSL
ncbi:MAG: fatty acid desaturase, partial [Bdellovibrionales bacterium]|nr:fatty acid desaturase [Bdellovibrionales bacterium]